MALARCWITTYGIIIIWPCHLYTRVTNLNETTHSRPTQSPLIPSPSLYVLRTFPRSPRFHPGSQRNTTQSPTTHQILNPSPSRCSRTRPVHRTTRRSLRNAPPRRTALPNPQNRARRGNSRALHRTLSISIDRRPCKPLPFLRFRGGPAPTFCYKRAFSTLGSGCR